MATPKAPSSKEEYERFRRSVEGQPRYTGSVKYVSSSRPFPWWIVIVLVIVVIVGIIVFPRNQTQPVFVISVTPDNARAISTCVRVGEKVTQYADGQGIPTAISDQKAVEAACLESFSKWFKENGGNWPSDHIQYSGNHQYTQVWQISDQIRLGMQSTFDFYGNQERVINDLIGTCIRESK